MTGTSFRKCSALVILTGCFLPGVGLRAGEPAADFRSACANLAAAAEGAGRIMVPGRDGWLFLVAELRHVGAGRFWGEAAAEASRATQPDQADPLPAILDFKRQLDELGIELLLVPVPPKAIIYPEYIEGSFASRAPAERWDTFHHEFYALLQDQGADILDLTPAFLTARATDGPDEPPLYCRQDSHWSGRACVLAAKEIARHLRGRPWLEGRTRTDYITEPAEIELSGDLWTPMEEPRPAREKVALRRVLAGDAPVPPARNSPVLVLGDSHALVFHAGGDMHAAGAGLADQLAYELGFPVDVLGVRGSGATPARLSLYRRARGTPGYLEGKKIVIWCFGAREFTESSGWSKVPVR